MATLHAFHTRSVLRRTWRYHCVHARRHFPFLVYGVGSLAAIGWIISIMIRIG